MFWDEYIMEIWEIPTTIIIFLLVMSEFINKIIKVRELTGRKKIKRFPGGSLGWAGFVCILLIGGVWEEKMNSEAMGNLVQAIGFSIVAMKAYNFNFISNEGLFIDGELILWMNVKTWRCHENNKDTIVIEYYDKLKHKESEKNLYVWESQAWEIEEFVNSKLDNELYMPDEVLENVNHRILLSKILCGVLIIGFLLTSYVGFNPKDIEEFLGDVLNSEKYMDANISRQDNTRDSKALDSKQDIERAIEEVKKMQVRQIPFSLVSSRYKYDKIRFRFTDRSNNKIDFEVYKDSNTLHVTQGKKTEYYWIESGEPN